MREGDLRTMARQAGIVPSSTRTQSHWYKQEDQRGPVMITKILGSAKNPAITQQVCIDETCLRSSQKVKSVIEDLGWGGPRQKTGHKYSHHEASASQTPSSRAALCALALVCCVLCLQHKCQPWTKFLCGTQDSKSRRLILTGPTSGHLTEVINYQGPAHTNWLSLPWAGWPGASPHAPSAHCLRSSTWAQAWAPSYGFSYVIGVPAPSPLLLSGFSGLTLGLICLPCLMITGPSGEPVAITPLLCLPCSDPVGLCPGHEGSASAHVVITLGFLLAFLLRAALFLLLPDPALGGLVPLDTSSVTAGRDRHIQRQFCSQVGLNGTQRCLYSSCPCKGHLGSLVHQDR